MNRTIVLSNEDKELSQDSDEISLDFSVPTEGGMLSVTLVWTDYPSVPVSFVSLINDLDLEVVDSSGVTHFGNEYLNGRVCTHATCSLHSDFLFSWATWVPLRPLR